MPRIELIEADDEQDRPIQGVFVDLLDNAIAHLTAWGVPIERCCVSDPKACNNAVLQKLLSDYGPLVLPVTLVDGKVAKMADYPNTEDLMRFGGFELEEHDGGPDHDCDCGCEHDEDCDCEHGEDCDCGHCRP